MAFFSNKDLEEKIRILNSKDTYYENKSSMRNKLIKFLLISPVLLFFIGWIATN